MFDLHERRKLRRYLFSHLTLAVLLVLAGMLGWSVWGIAQKEQETMQKREEVGHERDALIERGEELSQEITNLRSGQGIEAELRQRFEVGAPGEKLIVIVDPEMPQEVTKPSEKKGFWGWVTSWFD